MDSSGSNFTQKTLNTMWKSTKRPFRYTTTYYRRVRVLKRSILNANVKLCNVVSQSSTNQNLCVQSTSRGGCNANNKIASDNVSGQLKQTIYDVASTSTVLMSPAPAATFSVAEAYENEYVADSLSANDIVMSSDDENNLCLPSGDGGSDEESDEENSLECFSSILSEVEKMDMLREWALRNRITHTATNELLEFLKDVAGMSYLPKTSRTFLHTPTRVVIEKMGSGEYWHNGLQKCVKQYFHDIEESTTLFLSFNMDGLPIHKSSKKQFWPILCIDDSIPSMKPLIIGIYYGEEKPPLNDFLKQFVDELLPCVENGITVNGHQINVKIKCFICDTPARCFIKGTMCKINSAVQFIRIMIIHFLILI